MDLKITKLEKNHIKEIAAAFKKLKWNKSESLYFKYLKEQKSNKRLVLIAILDNKFAGYLTIVWKSKYAPFKCKKIPEIVDLNVLPKYRQNKIGTNLMNKAEEIIKQKSKEAGIGVGLAPGYRFAQKMYVKRGYIPDGLGIDFKDKKVKFGQKVVADDSLVLHFIKRLK